MGKVTSIVSLRLSGQRQTGYFIKPVCLDFLAVFYHSFQNTMVTIGIDLVRKATLIYRGHLYELACSLIQLLKLNNNNNDPANRVTAIYFPVYFQRCSPDWKQT